MRKCPYCKIEVGGDLVKCPICQSRLNGEPEAPYFPKQTGLQLKSFFYKIQLFIVWIVVIGSLGADLLLNIKIYPGCYFHWSYLVAMWLFAFEFGIIRLFKVGFASSRVVSMFVIIVMGMLFITAFYLGFLEFVKEWVAPIVVMGTLVTNFVLAMNDKHGNAMVYLLSNLIVGILPYIVLYIMTRNAPIAWVVCLIVSVILFVGAVIFKGREVVSEFQKRLNV